MRIFITIATLIIVTASSANESHPLHGQVFNHYGNPIPFVALIDMDKEVILAVTDKYGYFRPLDLVINHGCHILTIYKPGFEPLTVSITIRRYTFCEFTLESSEIIPPHLEFLYKQTKGWKFPNINRIDYPKKPMIDPEDTVNRDIVHFKDFNFPSYQ